MPSKKTIKALAALVNSTIVDHLPEDADEFNDEVAEVVDGILSRGISFGVELDIGHDCSRLRVEITRDEPDLRKRIEPVPVHVE